MNAVIESIYATGQVADAEGRALPSKGSPVQHECGALLYSLVREEGLHSTLEVGMAYGLSTLFICQAHRDSGGGRHLAIDPYQEARYRSIGVLNVRRAGLEDYFALRQSPSCVALPQLAGEGLRIDLAFIDGFHTFDHTLVDFFHIDRMLRVGGYVVFDDLWMPAVRKAVSFVLRNRAYRMTRHRSPIRTASAVRRVARIGRRFLQTPLTADVVLKLWPWNICVLRKEAEDTRAWNHYRRF